VHWTAALHLLSYLAVPDAGNDVIVAVDWSCLSNARWNTATSVVQDTSHPRTGDQSRT